MITEKDLYGIKHYEYGEAYYGSDGPMRFRLARDPLKNTIYLKEADKLSDNPKLLAEVWFSPLGYEKTPREDMISSEFDLDEDGYKEAVNWLNRMLDEH